MERSVIFNMGENGSAKWTSFKKWSVIHSYNIRFGSIRHNKEFSVDVGVKLIVMLHLAKNSL